jgi:4-hydroxybenzoyl-CoA reductase subunit alpha
MKEHTIIGERIERTDFSEKVTGLAKYTGDMALPGILYGKILRSPHPHAKILNLNTDKAERLPGVKAVVTGKDTAGRKFGVWPQTRDQCLLAMDKVRFIGEEVAAVAAIDEDIAEEALDLIEVEYEVLPAVFDAGEAMKEGAPQLHNHIERNIGMKAFCHFGDVEEGFRMSHRIYEEKNVSSKTSHCQIEPYAALASFDPSGKLNIWAPNQAPFAKRRVLSTAFGIPLNKVRINRSYVGGAHGGRSDTFPAEFCAALLSMKTKRPVRITYSREEAMVATRHKHSLMVDFKVGVKEDGTIMAKDIRATLDGGAYMSSGNIATFVPYTYAESVYRVPSIRYEAARVYTNKTPCSMSRAHANQVVVLEEMIMDRIAQDLGIDPMEIRLRHALKAGETLPSKSKLTSFALTETIEKAAAEAGWKEKRGKMGIDRGIGIACTAALAGFNIGFRLNSSALVKFDEDGSATLFSGNLDNGQGNESMLVQVASEELGIPLEDISLVCSDTELLQDPGTYSMTSTFVSGNAAKAAAADAGQQIKKIAAESLGVDSKDLRLGERRVYVKGQPEEGMAIADVVRLAFAKGEAILGKGSYTLKPASEVGWADWPRGKIEGQQGGAYTPGTTIAEVEVDRETGQVKVVNIVQAYDCGFAINPTTVEGQWQGAAVFQLGDILYEKLVWDEKSGQLLTDSLLAYKIPTAPDVPRIKPFVVESIDAEGPYGAKEIGGSGAHSVAPAIVSAVYDAIGVWMRDFPITPENVLQALKEKEERNIL